MKDVQLQERELKMTTREMRDVVARPLIGNVLLHALSANNVEDFDDSTSMLFVQFFPDSNPESPDEISSFSYRFDTAENSRNPLSIFHECY